PVVPFPVNLKGHANELLVIVVPLFGRTFFVLYVVISFHGSRCLRSRRRPEGSHRQSLRWSGSCSHCLRVKECVKSVSCHPVTVVNPEAPTEAKSNRSHVARINAGV